MLINLVNYYSMLPVRSPAIWLIPTLLLCLWNTAGQASSTTEPLTRLRKELVTFHDNLNQPFAPKDWESQWQKHWQSFGEIRSHLLSAENGGLLDAGEALQMRNEVLRQIHQNLRDSANLAIPFLTKQTLDFDSAWLLQRLDPKASLNTLGGPLPKARSRSERIFAASLEAELAIESYERKSALGNLCRLLKDAGLGQTKNISDLSASELLQIMGDRPTCLEIDTLPREVTEWTSAPEGEKDESEDRVQIPVAPTLQLISDRPLELSLATVIVAPGMNLSIHASAFGGGLFDLSSAVREIPGGSLTIDITSQERSRRPVFVSLPAQVQQEEKQRPAEGILLFLNNGEISNSL